MTNGAVQKTISLMNNNYYKYFHLIILILGVAVILTGCATQGPYFRLDNSLQQNIRTIGGTEYLPLAEVCNVYDLDYKWDGLIRTATIRKGNDSIVLRADGSRALVNDAMVRMNKPAIMSNGALLVPVAFVRSNLGGMAGVGPAKMPTAPAEEAPKRFLIKTIVIDAGHGGKDPGAIGRRTRVKEKDLTLYLARKLKYILKEAGLKVIMTRDSDIFIPLTRRSEIANEAGADLFVSVHINASVTRSLNGFECYYLSNATDDNSRALEAFENSSLKMNESASAERSKLLDKTLWDMALTENRIESSELASHICDSVDSSLVMGNRGIRSARFYVLKYTNIPAVLVEAGYLSNKYDERKLKDQDFLDRVAKSIADGILKYKIEYEKTEGFTKA